MIPRSALAYRQDSRQPPIPATLAGNARAGTQAQLDADRWIDEEGSLGSEATAPSSPRRERMKEMESAIEQDNSGQSRPNEASCQEATAA